MSAMGRKRTHLFSAMIRRAQSLETTVPLVATSRPPRMRKRPAIASCRQLIAIAHRWK